MFMSFIDLGFPKLHTHFHSLLSVIASKTTVGFYSCPETDLLKRLDNFSSPNAGSLWNQPIQKTPSSS